jgi:lipopolysaccharide transport system permease protein
MFASAVFYPAVRIQQASPVAWSVLKFNPVLVAIEESRNVLLWHQPLNHHHLLFLYCCGLAGFWGGHAVFARLKPAFADVL